MDKFNSGIVIATLEKIVQILEKNNIEYRFLGSVVIAAINGKLHRRLGDLDLIIDIQDKDVLYTELKNLGYKKAKGIFGFGRKYLCLETLDHPTLLGVGYFYGTWRCDGLFAMGNKQIKIYVEEYAVREIEYNLHGIRFKGIPSRAIGTGIMVSKSNPKRQRELELLKEKNIVPFPNTYIHINIYGMSADWIYHFTMVILNIIGNIRVKLGLAFDPWR